MIERGWIQRLGGALGAGALLALVACSDPGADNGASDSETPRKTARQIDALFLDLARKELSRAPESAAEMGISEDLLGFEVTSRINDRSQAAFERARLDRLDILTLLEDAPLPPEGSRRRQHLETVIAAYRSSDQIASFGHGQAQPGFARPYVMDQLSGGYLDLPDLLMGRHTIQNRADAEDWLIRLAALDESIEDETRRLLADRSAGIQPPAFILSRMAETARQFQIAPEGEDHMMVTSFANKLLGVPELTTEDAGKLVIKAREIVEADVLPAYAALERTLREIRLTASPHAGLWQFETGEAYYAEALRFYAGEGASANALHDEGVELVRALTRDLNGALAAAGLEEGSVGERLAALGLQEGQVFTNDDEGRAALIASMNADLARAQALQPRIFARPAETPIVIAAVPRFLQDTAPGGYYTPAPADRTAPGLFYINLRDTAEWPRFTLPTLVFHETLPGHHAESAIAAETGELPLIRQMIWHPAYGEGWALYAEDLVDEFGLYDDDPLGRIGYQQSLLFRAARLVADTGLHAKQWSREQAIDYLVRTTGQPRSAMETEVDRYTVWPGQAVSYMVGRQRIRAMRARAEAVLGQRFDLAAFHHAILSGGPRPLDILEADIDRWVTAQLPEAAVE